MGKEMKLREKLIDYAVFALLLAAVCAVTLTLFYNQCIHNMQGAQIYEADMKAYILEMQGLNVKYSFPYPIFFRFAALLHLFTSPEMAVALATMILNAAAVVIVKLAFNKMTFASLTDATAGMRRVVGIGLSVLAVSLFFVSMLFPPKGIYLPGIKFTYLGVFSPNPFHNATYMTARPFALLAFLWYVKLLDVYEKGADRKDYVLFALFLLLATMTKPSFTLILVAAAGLIMLYRLIRSRGGNLKGTLLLGLTFVPTFIDLLYQFKGVFVPEEGAEGGIGFCFGRIWSLYSDNIPLAICLAAGFPILVLVLNFRELRDNTLYRFSWQIYLMGFATAFFCYEKGFRSVDFNFSWGYMYGLFFVFFGAATVLVKATLKRERPALLALQWLALAWHLMCGSYYFYNMSQGITYY